MGIIEGTIPEGVSGQRIRVARGEYSFAADGGAVSTIALIGAADIPSGATILGGWLEVQTQPTSGGAATMAIQIEGANDTVTEAAYGGAPWSTTGLKSIIPVFTGATMLRTTAARDISLVIGTAALTAGKFSVLVIYLNPLA